MKIHLIVLTMVARLPCWCQRETCPSPRKYCLTTLMTFKIPDITLYPPDILCRGLDGSTCSECLPEGTCEFEPPERVPWTSARAKLAPGIQAGSKRATEPRARETTPAGREKMPMGQKTHLYIVVLIWCAPTKREIMVGGRKNVIISYWNRVFQLISQKRKTTYFFALGGLCSTGMGWLGLWYYLQLFHFWKQARNVVR